jgi:hypothetical protein
MNHYDFMVNKSRKKDMMDYVKNTGKPRKYRGGGGRGGVGKGGGGGKGSQPMVNLSFYMGGGGGREILSFASQPHPYNQQLLPINLNQAQPNPQAMAGAAAQARVDLNEVLQNQREHAQSLQDMRDQMANQLLPDVRQQIIDNMNQAHQQNTATLAGLDQHNREVNANLEAVHTRLVNFHTQMDDETTQLADAIYDVIGRLNTNEENNVRRYEQLGIGLSNQNTVLLNNLEVNKALILENMKHNLSMGKGYQKQSQDELMERLKQYKESGAMNEQSMKIFEDMQNYVNNPKPSRGSGGPSRPSSIPEEVDIEAGAPEPQEEERRFSTPQSAGRKFMKWISGGAKSQEKPPIHFSTRSSTSLEGAATNEPQYQSVPPAPARMRLALPPTPEARQSMFQDSDGLVEIDLSAMNVSRNLDQDFSDLNLDV